MLVAGDLVAGRWDDDLDGFAIFGATTTLSGQRDAVREAASIYYRQWRAQFRRHGLRVYPAVGDHEIGDDEDSWAEEHEQALVPTFRNLWSRSFNYRRNGVDFQYPIHPPRGTQHAGTAYAFRSGPVFFVTVDVFHQRHDGSVHPTIVGSQLKWLQRVLQPRMPTRGEIHRRPRAHSRPSCQIRRRFDRTAPRRRLGKPVLARPRTQRRRSVSLRGGARHQQGKPRRRRANHARVEHRLLFVQLLDGRRLAAAALAHAATSARGPGDRQPPVAERLGTASGVACGRVGSSSWGA